MPRPVTQVSHDPFARTSVLRVTVEPEVCSWCGSKRGRFLYAVQDDARAGVRSPEWSRHAFCSISCWRTYGS